MDKLKPPFEEGGKWHKFLPAFTAFETFLFVPAHTTNKGSHIRDGIDLKRTMIAVVIALIPCMLFGMWNVGHQHYRAIGELSNIGDGLWLKLWFGFCRVLPIIIVSYVFGLGVEFIFAIIRKHQVNEGFLVSGLLIPLVMPVDVPLWMVAIATIFAVVIGKEVFGGTGMNVLNPALTARAFLFFAYPTKMSGNVVWTHIGNGNTTVDSFTGATPLGDLAGLIKLDAGSQQLDAIMAKVPGIMDCFYGWIPGSIGETSALACILGAIFLLFTGIASWRVMFSMFAGGLCMALLFNVWDANPFMAVNPLHQLMMGGFMFGTVFMATDPVTSSQTNTGKLIYGFLTGLLAIMIRVFNPAYPEGVMMAILFMNVMAPLIDHIVIQSNIKGRMKRLKAAQTA